MILRVSASLLQPSGTNFRHTLELWTLVMRAEDLSVCVCLLVGVQLAEQHSPATSKWAVIKYENAKMRKCQQVTCKIRQKVGFALEFGLGWVSVSLVGYYSATVKVMISVR